MTITMQSEVGTIQRIVLKHASAAFGCQDVINEQWQTLNYVGPPAFDEAEREYDEFVSIFRELGMDVSFLSAGREAALDSVYVRDAAIMCDNGAILCNMGKRERRGEPSVQEAHFRELGIPIVGTVSGDATVEGGDVAWIDEKTLAIGRGYRTNDAGINQIGHILGDCVEELVVVPLPHWRGPDDVFHLMSILSPIDVDLALVYSPLMPVPFREYLLARGLELVDVPDEEFESMGTNVLAVGNRTCVMLAGNPTTQKRLKNAGATVIEFSGNEICRKGAGGPTCLTRPLERLRG